MFVTLILGLVLAPAALAQSFDSSYQFMGSAMMSTTPAQACSEHCDYCSYDGVCHGCESGYGLTPQATCIECGPGCASCYDFGSAAGLQCSYCMYGYGAMFDQTTDLRQCLQCPDNCDYCMGPDSRCELCMDGYAGPQCAPIRTECAEHENCRTCYDENDETICQDCEEGFGVNSENECEVCSEGCLGCRDYGTGQVQCTQCANGYGYVYDYGQDAALCLKCTDNCISCWNENYSNDVSNAVLVCGSCEDGFTGPNCAPIIEECSDDSCLTCYAVDDGSERCTNCTEGHGADSNEQCQDCGEGCQNCYEDTYTNNGMQCNWCRDGYVYSYNYETSSVQCLQCPANCRSCSDYRLSGASSPDLRCEVCMPGFVGQDCSLAGSVLQNANATSSPPRSNATTMASSASGTTPSGPPPSSTTSIGSTSSGTTPSGPPPSSTTSGP